MWSNSVCDNSQHHFMHPVGFELNQNNLHTSGYALFQCGFGYYEEFNVLVFATSRPDVVYLFA
jgi:hypothetical protein